MVTKHLLLGCSWCFLADSRCAWRLLDCSVFFMRQAMATLHTFFGRSICWKDNGKSIGHLLNHHRPCVDACSNWIETSDPPKHPLMIRSNFRWQLLVDPSMHNSTAQGELRSTTLGGIGPVALDSSWCAFAGFIIGLSICHAALPLRECQSYFTWPPIESIPDVGQNPGRFFQADLKLVSPCYCLASLVNWVWVQRTPMWLCDFSPFASIFCCFAPTSPPTMCDPHPHQQMFNSFLFL